MVKRKKSGGTNLLLVIKAILANDAVINHKVLSLVKLFERQRDNLTKNHSTKEILELQNQAYEDGRLKGYDEGLEEGKEEGYQGGYDTCYDEAMDLGFDMSVVSQFVKDGGTVEDLADEEIEETAIREAVVSPYNSDVF